MKIPPVDLAFLRDHLGELAAQLTELWETSGHADDDVDAPRLLRDAVNQLFGVLGQVEGNGHAKGGDTTEINALTEYGLHLLEELVGSAKTLKQLELADQIERLALPFALWTARHGGEIRNLSPVVNALAQYANHASHPQTMAGLYTCCCELVEAASPACEESGGDNPGDPWRLLLLNRAIVATRSHNPELMETAFDAIVDQLPGDAQRFFAEGMEQMVAIDYPDHVQDVVRRYYLAHAVPRRLH